MQGVLSDIKAHLQGHLYRSREQVQLGIVLRLLASLGWNVWSPREVCPQYTVPGGGARFQVDLALFLGTAPAAFVKVVESDEPARRVEAAERDLTEIRHRIAVPLNLVTDGRKWRLYLTESRGSFDETFFERLDLLSDPPGEIEQRMRTYLGRESIQSGRAVKAAKELLRHSKMESVLRRSLATAQQLAKSAEVAAVAEMLVQLAKSQGYNLRPGEAVEFIEAVEADRRWASSRVSLVDTKSPETTRSPGTPALVDRGDGVRRLDPRREVDLRYTTVDSGQVGGEPVTKWSSLLDTAIRIACERGLSLGELERITTARFKKSRTPDPGFHNLDDVHLSVESLDFSGCYRNAFLIATHLKVPLKVAFHWRAREGAAYPGERGLLSWTPEN